jgi:hypothetical protein
MITAAIIALAFARRDNARIGKLREVGLCAIDCFLDPRRLARRQHARAAGLKERDKGDRGDGDGYCDFEQREPCIATTGRPTYGCSSDRAIRAHREYSRDR